MKANLNVVVDLGDEFIECEGGSEECISVSISEAVQDSLRYSLKNEILKNLSKEELSNIRKEIREYVLKNIESFVRGAIDSELKSLKIKSNDYYEYNDMIDASTYIKNNLEKAIKNSDTSHTVKSIAEKYVETIKERYDMVFASTLLDKMLKSNLLKDDCISTLLGNPNTPE